MSERDTSVIVNGKRILLALLLTIPVLFAATWVSLRHVESKLATDDRPLVWADRASWPTPPIKRTTLERPRSASPFEGGGRQATSKYERLDFALSPEVESVVKEAAALAERSDFASEEVGAHLRELAARSSALLPRAEGEPPEQSHRFYLDYLLGVWHEARGEASAADAAFSRAFAQAPAAIKVRFVNVKDEPAAGLALGDAELALDRVVDADPEADGFQEHLDQTLKLVYPRLVTDAGGTVYLPAFHSVYRWARKPEPTGYEVRYVQADGWFQFPGRIGSPYPAVVLPAEPAAAP